MNRMENNKNIRSRIIQYKIRNKLLEEERINKERIHRTFKPSKGGRVVDGKSKEVIEPSEEQIEKYSDLPSQSQKLVGSPGHKSSLTSDEYKNMIKYNIRKAEEARDRIKDTSQYMIPGEKDRTYYGDYIKTMVYNPYIESLEEADVEAGKIPSGYTIVKKNDVFSVVPPVEKDIFRYSKRQSATKEVINKVVNPVAGALYDIGTAGWNWLASLARSSVKYLPWTGPQLYGYGGGMFGPKQASYASEGLMSVHFPTAMDFVFEPVGWSPKGSIDEMFRRGPIYIAGSVATEIIAGYGIGKASLPLTNRISKYIVKPISSRVSPYVGRFTGGIANRFYEYSPKWLSSPIKRFVEFSPKRYGLGGRMVAPYFQSAKSRIWQSFSNLKQELGSRIGSGRLFNITRETIFKRHIFGRPVFLESKGTLLKIGGIFKRVIGVKNRELLMGTKNMWWHPSRSTLSKIRGGDITSKIIGYSPLDEELTTVMMRKSWNPLRFKRFRMVEDVLGSKYSYEYPSNFSYVRDNVWRVGDEIPTTSYMRSVDFGGQAVKDIGKIQPLYEGLLGKTSDIITSKFSTGGFPIRIHMTRAERNLLNLIESYKPVYEPMSRLIPDDIISRIPKQIYLPPRLGVGNISKVTKLFGMIGIGAGGNILSTANSLILVNRVKPGFNIMNRVDQRLLNMVRTGYLPVSRNIYSSDIRTIQKTDKMQGNVQIQNQVLLQKQITKQLQKATPIPDINRRIQPIPPFIPLLPNLYGSGRKGMMDELWTRFYREREFKIPSVFSLMGIGTGGLKI